MTRATEMHHRTRFMVRLKWRKLVEAEVAKAFHIIAWLLTPRQIPNEEIGYRRRNGHCLSSGSSISSEDYQEQGNNKLNFLLKQR